MRVAMLPIVAMLTATTAITWEPAPAAARGRFTLPLPSPDLPAGTLTVKVVGEDLRDLKVGQPVVLLQATPASGLNRLKVTPTGEDGRARFTGLKSGARLMVEVEIKPSEQKHRSQAFTVPPKGGLRLLLTLGAVEIGATAGDRLPKGHPPVPSGLSAPSRAQEEAGGAATIEPVRELEVGQVQVVVVKGGKRLPQVGVPVTANPRGKKARHRATTDGDGKALLQVPPAQIDGLGLQVTFDGLTYRSRRLVPPPAGGLRATFVVFDRTRDRDHLTLAPGSRWIFQIGEGVINVMQLLNLRVRREVIFDPGPDGLAIPLPAGVVNVELAPELAGILKIDRQRGVMRLAAPVPPGGLPLRLFYALPYEGPSAEFRQRTALAVPESVVAVLNSDQVEILGPSISGSSPRQRAPAGAGVAFDLEPVAAGSTVEFTIQGLPHRSRTMLFVVLGLAGLIVLWGAFGALSGSRRASATAEQQEQLIQKLLQIRRSKGASKGNKPQKQQELKQRLQRLWEESW